MSTEVNIDGIYVSVPLVQFSALPIVPIYGMLRHLVSFSLVSATIFILKLVPKLVVKTESFVIYNHPQAYTFRHPGLDVTTWFDGILLNLIHRIKSRQEIYSEGIIGFSTALYNPYHAGEVMCAILAFASAFEDLFKWDDLVRMYHNLAGGSRSYAQCYHLITSNFKFFWVAYSAGKCGELWKHYKIYPAGFRNSLMFSTYLPHTSVITGDFVDQVFEYVHYLLAKRAHARGYILTPSHIKLLSKNRMKKIVKWIPEQFHRLPEEEEAEELEELEEEEEQQQVEVQQLAPEMQDAKQEVNEMKQQIIDVQPEEKQEEKQQQNDIETSQVDENDESVSEEEFKKEDYDDENGPDEEFDEEDFGVGESDGQPARKRVKLTIDI